MNSTNASIAVNSKDGSTQSPIRLLLIEDDEAYQKYVQLVLSRHYNYTFSLACASSLAAATDFLFRKTPDLILLDLGLPESEGIATFTSIQKLAPHVPITILTVDANQDMGMQAVALGAQDYLVKQKIGDESLVRCILYSIERRKAEHSQQRLAAIKDFMTMLAHDLTIPILGADRVLEVLLSGTLGKLAPEQEQVLSSLKTSNRDLIHKVQRLIQIYRYESAAENLSFVPLELQGIISLCLESFKQRIAEKGLEVLTDFSWEPNPVMGDKQALEDLFTNLIDNAVRYSTPGTQIKICAETLTDSVTINFHNCGEPISLEQQQALFQGFWLGEPGKRYVSSTGLGLYCCQRIVNLHGGRIICTSSSDSGTVFSVSLPIIVDYSSSKTQTVDSG